MWKVVWQNDTDVMSLSMQLKKVGLGLLPEAFKSEREYFARGKRGGSKRKDRSWKTNVNIGLFKLIKQMFSKL